MLSSPRQRLAEARQAFASIVTNRNLTLLEVSWAGTVCAYWIFIITLSLYAYQRGGPTAVGLVGLLRLLPAVVAVPFGAILGDRFPRERVIVAINLGRSLTIAGASVAAFTHSPAAIVYVLSSLMGLLQALFRPTQAALLPLLVRSPGELTAANLVLTSVESVGIFVGPAIGGLLLAATGTETVFAITAGAFLFSALLLVGIHPVRSGEPRRLAEGFVREAFAGYRTILHDRRLRLLIGLYGSQTLVAGALNVLIVVMSLEMLHLGKAGIGFLSSALGVGGLLAGLGALGLVGRAHLARIFAVGLVFAGLPLALISALPNVASALILLALVGAGTMFVDVAGVTLLQRAVPDEVLSRVMGVVQSVFVGTLALGAIVTPGLIAAFGNRGALVAIGLVPGALAVLAWPRLRRLDAQMVVPSRELELMASLPIFHPLPPATLEQLASHLRRVAVQAGEDVVRQGEPGDRFYIVADGELEVLVDGQAREPLRPGGSFGEIALLHNVPRTATVRARTDANLLALDRDEFLAAVTGSAESSEAAHAVAAARLGSLRTTVASV